MDFDEIKYVVFDLNGTLSNYGKIDTGIKEHFNILHQRGIETVMLTSDQRNTAKAIAKKLGVKCVIAKNSEEKGEFVRNELDGKVTVAIGNARNDIPMFDESALSIVTLLSEGIHTKVLMYADIVVPSFKDALNLLIDRDTFEATMKS